MIEPPLFSYRLTLPADMALACWNAMAVGAGAAPRALYERSTSMDDLIKLITERTGLPADQARAAAQTTIDFLKEKLPESMRGYVDMALNSGMIDDVAGQAGNILGGLFGGTKE
jgi:hypothetical protein